MKNPLRRQPECEPKPVAGFFPETATLRDAPPPGPDDAYFQPGGGLGFHSWDAAQAVRVRQVEEVARGRDEMRRGDGQISLAEVVRQLGELKRKVDADE